MVREHIHNRGETFALWSPVVSAYVSAPMTEGQVRAYVQDQFGRAGLEHLPERLAEAKATGCSGRYQFKCNPVPPLPGGPKVQVNNNPPQRL